MPRLSDEVAVGRRRHVLESAWRCFSRDGFHATTMDDVIAATGWSSSAVYRYARSKDELIEAAARESLGQFDAVVTGLLAADPVPTPAQALTSIVAALDERARHQGYDLTRIVVQAWSEGLRNPSIATLARGFWDAARHRLTALATAWREAGHVPADVAPEDVAGTLTLLVPGLVLDHTLLDGAATQAVLRAVGVFSP
ncbi:MAG: TetR/AcrR family transcriptional regulator [Actinobacteria bacterium]|nr:TetR/AcrR family transcriptional regulator [Actinomycetota bacterium]